MTVPPQFPFDDLSEAASWKLLEPVLSMVHSIGVSLSPGAQSAFVIATQGQLTSPAVEGLRLRLPSELLGPELYAFIARNLLLPATTERLAQWAHPMHLEELGTDLVIVNDLPELAGPPPPRVNKAVARRWKRPNSDAPALQATLESSDAPLSLGQACFERNLPWAVGSAVDWSKIPAEVRAGWEARAAAELLPPVEPSEPLQFEPPEGWPTKP